MCKYLNNLGFNAYEFGVHVDGDVGVDASGDYEVCSKVSPEAAKEIAKFLNQLERRVEDYIDIHYNGDFAEKRGE